MINKRKSRRHFLARSRCGSGITLDGIAPAIRAGADCGGSRAANKPPLRFRHPLLVERHQAGALVGQGQRRGHGVRSQRRAAQEHAQDIVFIKGLFNEQAFKNPSPHQGRNANLLSGAWVSSDPSDIRVGTSMDQVLAREIGARTAVPSMALGIEPNELRLEDGLSMIYASNISWETPTRPATKEIYPARVFDPLGGRRQGPQARPQHPGRRAAGHARPAAQDQQRRPQEARRVSGIGAIDREAHRHGLQAGAHRRLATHARHSPTCRGRRTRFRRTFPTT